jgi:hypothetical protein
VSGHTASRPRIEVGTSNFRSQDANHPTTIPVLDNADNFRNTRCPTFQLPDYTEDEGRIGNIIMTAVPPNSRNTKYCLPCEYEIYTEHYWENFILHLDGLITHLQCRRWELYLHFPHILMAWCLFYNYSETLLCLYLTGIIKGLQNARIKFEHRDSAKSRPSVLNCTRKAWKDLVRP